MIQVYTGNGKGKTTAAMGLAIRALGHGMKVSIVQFFKSKNFYGEQKILSKLKNFKLYSFACTHPCFNKNVKKNNVKNECCKSLEEIKSIISGNKFDLLILDELNIALRDGFMDVDQFLKVLKKRPAGMEIVITGRGAPAKLLKIADLVSEIKDVKHPFKRGVKSRKGIEY